MKTYVHIWYLSTFQLYGKPNTHFYVQYIFFFFENCALWEIMWYDKPDRPKMTVPSIHISCWIPKATNILRICNTVLSPFPRQQWLGQVLSLLRYNTLLCESSDCGLLTVTLLMWRIWWAPTNASKWQMGFNSVFKGLRKSKICETFTTSIWDEQIRWVSSRRPERKRLIGRRSGNLIYL